MNDRQLMLLRGACDQRLAICKKKYQNPYLEVAVFYILLHTGLRESELCSLNIAQYYDGGFHDVKRKGRMITKKVFLPTIAREKLDEYLQTRNDLNIDNDNRNEDDNSGQGDSSDGKNNNQSNIGAKPLLIVRTGNRITSKDVQRICQRISKQACAQLPQKEKFNLTPHQLRHSFLKRITDKHGIHRAKKVSGNVGIRELFRYAQPSDEEIADNIEGLYE